MRQGNSITVSLENFTGKLPYTLTNDFFFKAFFQKNETALRGLLSALLSIKPEEITSLSIINPIHEGDTVDEKNVILDIKLILNDTQIVNLEILYSEYFLYNPKTSHKYSDKFGIYMLQLNQLGNPDDEKNMPELYYWAKLFKARTWEEIQMLAEKNECIKESILTLQELTADEKAKMQMEARERYRRDMAASKELGKQESEEVIQSLKYTIKEQQDTIRQSQAEKEKTQEENARVQAEKDERIRFLEEQLARAN